MKSATRMADSNWEVIDGGLDDDEPRSASKRTSVAQKPKATPVELTIAMPELAEFVSVLADSYTVMARAFPAMADRLVALEERLSVWMERTDAALNAPRKITLTRDGKGFVKDATSEIMKGS